MRGVQPIPAVSDVEDPAQDGKQDDRFTDTLPGVQVGPTLADVEHHDGSADTVVPGTGL